VPTYGALLVGRGLSTVISLPYVTALFAGRYTLLIASDFLVVPPVLRPQYNHIICPLPYPDVTEHLPHDLVIFG
jgi:hypothetical protein